MCRIEVAAGRILNPIGRGYIKITVLDQLAQERPDRVGLVLRHAAKRIKINADTELAGTGVCPVDQFIQFTKWAYNPMISR